MTDRVPGMPGQYKLTMNGQTLSVTIERDDQPLVEGTPYNKASVLPDSLANQLCPNVINPTPADALSGLSKKKYEVTLLASGWTSNSGAYKQKILLSSILGDSNESVKSWPIYSGNVDTDSAIRDACATITYAKTEAGSVTFVCLDEAPEVDIPVIVEVSR